MIDIHLGQTHILALLISKYPTVVHLCTMHGAKLGNVIVAGGSLKSDRADGFLSLFPGRETFVQTDDEKIEANTHYLSELQDDEYG
jgi:hypothetical protein